MFPIILSIESFKTMIKYFRGFNYFFSVFNNYILRVYLLQASELLIPTVPLLYGYISDILYPELKSVKST